MYGVSGVCSFPHAVFASIGFVQLPGGGRDAASGGAEGRRPARLQRLQEGGLPLPRRANHEHLQQFTRFCLSKVSSEESQDRSRTYGEQTCFSRCLKNRICDSSDIFKLLFARFLCKTFALTTSSKCSFANSSCKKCFQPSFRI